MLSLVRALRQRAFALLWSGQTLSRIGDHLYQIALAWWVLEQTGSATTMGLVLICAFTPTVIFLPLAGVLVDRMPRVTVLLVSDLLRGLLVLTITLVALYQQLAIWHILLVSLLFGLVDAFFQPAYTALVPQLTPQADWPSANALTSMSTQLGRILGPALGAGVVATLGATGAFAIDAATFLISALCLAPLLFTATSASAASAAPEPSLWRAAHEGFAVVLGQPVLWLALLTFALSNLMLAGAFGVTLPFLVRDHLHADVATLGFLSAVFPVGYLLGGIWLGRLRQIRRRGWLICGGLAVAGLMLAVFGLYTSLVVLTLAALINGVALEVCGLSWTHLLQALVPLDKLGRVASIDSLGSFVTVPLSYALAGWATDWLDPALVFVYSGLLTALVAGLALLHPAMRQCD
jgi:DHA3 family tetracycline resistance protein-like MFS transporter